MSTTDCAIVAPLTRSTLEAVLDRLPEERRQRAAARIAAILAEEFRAMGRPVVALRELQALAECIRYASTGQDYYFRQSSMRKLEVSGLVHRRIGHETHRVPAWLPTPAGLERHAAALAEGLNLNVRT